MATHWAVGDTIRLETARTAKHYVYALLDDDDAMFYVGMSCDPPARLRGHVYGGVSAVKAVLQLCKLKRMRILAGPLSEEEAFKQEQAFIRTLPGLLNQHGVGRDIDKLREGWRRKKRRRRAKDKLARANITQPIE